MNASDYYWTHTEVPQLNKPVACSQQLCTRIKELEYHQGGLFPRRIDMSDYEFGAFLFESVMRKYSIAAAFAHEKGFKTVVDIGNPTTEQSEWFQRMGISHIGVGVSTTSYIAGPEDIGEKWGANPCVLPPFDKQTTLGISQLCVGYLIWDSYRALYNRFDHLLLDDAPTECIVKMHELYGHSSWVAIPTKNIYGQDIVKHWYYFTKG